ncbi:unnamed protein product [Closterium sp. NIES-64]|nr:unnamed protein product [Closterium sp. NIES-64]
MKSARCTSCTCADPFTFWGGKRSLRAFFFRRVTRLRLSGPTTKPAKAWEGCEHHRSSALSNEERPLHFLHMALEGLAGAVEVEVEVEEAEGVGVVVGVVAGMGASVAAVAAEAAAAVAVGATEEAVAAVAEVAAEEVELVGVALRSGAA